MSNCAIVVADSIIFGTEFKRAGSLIEIASSIVTQFLRCLSSPRPSRGGCHYLTTRPCLDRRAVGSLGPLGAILGFVGRGWGQKRRSSACAITAYTMLSHGLPRLVTN